MAMLTTVVFFVGACTTAERQRFFGGADDGSSRTAPPRAATWFDGPDAILLSHLDDYKATCLRDGPVGDAAVSLDVRSGGGDTDSTLNDCRAVTQKLAIALFKEQRFAEAEAMLVQDDLNFSVPRPRNYNKGACAIVWNADEAHSKALIRHAAMTGQGKTPSRHLSARAFLCGKSLQSKSAQTITVDQVKNIHGAEFARQLTLFEEDVVKVADTTRRQQYQPGIAAGTKEFLLQEARAKILDENAYSHCMKRRFDHAFCGFYEDKLIDRINPDTPHGQPPRPVRVFASLTPTQRRAAISEAAQADALAAGGGRPSFSAASDGASSTVTGSASGSGMSSATASSAASALGSPRSGACRTSTAFLASRIPTVGAAMVDDVRTVVINEDIVNSMRQAGKQGYSPEAAIKLTLEQARAHDATAAQAVSMASSFDALGTSDEEFLSQMKSGKLRLEQCDGLRNNALCAAAVHKMGAIGNRAIAAEMQCHLRANSWPK